MSSEKLTGAEIAEMLRVPQRFQNKITGEILELPPPGPGGYADVLINGKAVTRVRYCDDGGGYTELPTGERLTTEQWSKYLIGLLGSHLKS